MIRNRSADPKPLELIVEKPKKEEKYVPGSRGEVRTMGPV